MMRRLNAPEMMDDFSITDQRLVNALDELRWVNRLLGGYAATMRFLVPFLMQQGGRRVRLLDLGTGVGDFPEHIVRWADRHGCDVEVTAVDANPATVLHARSVLNRRLPARLGNRIQVEVGDARALAYEDDAFDVVLTSLFLHHFQLHEVASLVREMNRLAAHGLIVNDLHRHLVAYLSIRALVTMLPVSAMFRHDGPLSVQRAFTRRELEEVAHRAGLPAFQVRWHWAFRWVLSTL